MESLSQFERRKKTEKVTLGFTCFFFTFRTATKVITNLHSLLAYSLHANEFEMNFKNMQWCFARVLANLTVLVQQFLSLHRCSKNLSQPMFHITFTSIPNCITQMAVGCLLMQRNTWHCRYQSYQHFIRSLQKFVSDF